jgi:hypothetical protein
MYLLIEIIFCIQVEFQIHGKERVSDYRCSMQLATTPGNAKKE